MSFIDRVIYLGGHLSKWYERRILPRAIDLVCGSSLFSKLRQNLLEGLSGRVVEVGFGSGTNSSFIPNAVTHYLAIEPSTDALALSGARRELSSNIHLIGASGEAIPITKESIDCVVFSFVLCSVEDPKAMIDECARILIPGGELRFIEHGRSASHSMARAQEILDPIERVIAGNCRLSRRPYDYIDEAHWQRKDAKERYLGPASPWTFVYSARYEKR